MQYLGTATAFANGFGAKNQGGHRDASQMAVSGEFVADVNSVVVILRLPYDLAPRRSTAFGKKAASIL